MATTTISKDAIQSQIRQLKMKLARQELSVQTTREQLAALQAIEDQLLGSAAQVKIPAPRA